LLLIHCHAVVGQFTAVGRQKLWQSRFVEVFDIVVNCDSSLIIQGYHFSGKSGSFELSGN